MKVFWAVVCILGCILFGLMSACFGAVGVKGIHDSVGSSLIGPFVFLAIAAALLFVAFLLGREAKRKLLGD